MKVDVPAAILLVLLASAPAARAQGQEAPSSDYGKTRAQAIEVCEPKGERAYLARLVCPDQSHPEFERAGSVGPRNPPPENMTEEQAMAMLVGDRFAPLAEGAIDLHIVDGYTVQCGEDTSTLYLDMYHCDVPPPDKAPEGFTLLR